MKTPIPNSSKTCVLYVRVSSKEQEKEGYSIPAQLKLLREYATNNGLELVHEFDNVNRKMSGREGYGRMMEFLKKTPSCRNVLVEKTDRLYRNLKDYVILEDFGLDIHFG